MAKSCRHSPSAYPRDDGMATIRKNALPDCQDFGGTRLSVAPSLWRPNLQIGRKTDAVARGLPAQRKGRGLALPHPALNQFLGQLLETPGARAKVNRWRAVSCAAGSQERLPRLSQDCPDPNNSSKNRLNLHCVPQPAGPAMDAAGRAAAYHHMAAHLLLNSGGDQEEERALSGQLTRPWSLMSFAAGRLSDRSPGHCFASRPR